MVKTQPDPIEWLPDVEGHDYPAAESYLSLLHSEEKVTTLLERMKRTPTIRFKAKDIFRASGLSRLGVSNFHVNMDRKKIKKGIPLSPLLLVRDEPTGRVVVADGYHRLCAVYDCDKDAWIPCKII